ncbi:MAG: hypothetical protein M1837_001591 [Sclerophora amabilis]|nr:MAG: hypothetical protein M1837_001591 [Sclerophora amabilis]
MFLRLFTCMASLLFTAVLGTHTCLQKGPGNFSQTDPYGALPYAELAAALNGECAPGFKAHRKKLPVGRQLNQIVNGWSGQFSPCQKSEIRCSDLLGHDGTGDGGDYWALFNRCISAPSFVSDKEYNVLSAADGAFHGGIIDHSLKDGSKCGFLIIRPVLPASA